MGYGDSGAPIEGVVSPEERTEHQTDASGAQAANQQFQSEEVKVAPDSGLVAFVAAAEYANRDHLVVQGKPVYRPQEGATSPWMRSRDGDVWAKFVEGILVTDDLQVIEWCDAHPKICRRSDDPMTKSWATLKELQARRANREQLLDPSTMDADESFPPHLMDAAREQAAKPDSPGGRLVESAEVSKHSIEQKRADSDPSVS
jgi:hypothetical protein